jgi:adenylate cyclase
MDRYCEEPTLSEILADPGTLALMAADRVNPRDVTATLSMVWGTLAARSLRGIGEETHRVSAESANAIPAERGPNGGVELSRDLRTRWDMATLRNNLRLASGLTLLAFVVCHLTAHSFLLVSLERATTVLNALMYPWRTNIGTTILFLALLTHYLNALWSIYVWRYLRLARWEFWQLCLGLCIPLLLISHVTGTRIAEDLLGVSPNYASVLMVQWELSPWLGFLQMTAVLTVWTHACIGMHFWLRTQPSYTRLRPLLVSLALLLPTLALSGYIAMGNQVLRAATDPDFARLSLQRSNLTQQKALEIERIAGTGALIYVALTLLPFVGRGARGFLYRRHRPPFLTHSSGRSFPILPGATVLETLRENGVPHASICGGRARCTTCRVLVTKGLDELPQPSGLEAEALARICATPDMRLACQIRPTADTSVMPLLAADASMTDAMLGAGLAGSERPITVLFVDLRGSSRIGEAKLPYDFLYILNQFFHEMTKALDASNGHYSQFTGDGLMALYGLNDRESAAGAANAMRGAREMLARMDQLNSRLRGDLQYPLRIGIGIHFSEAIVGAMGPPGSQVISAVGKTVNICARLQNLTKVYDCRVIVSRHAAEMAGLDAKGREVQKRLLDGMDQSIEFYALSSLADLRL